MFKALFNRVVVTGIGLETPLGSTIDKVWENLIKGVSGIKRLDSIIDVEDLTVKIGAPVENFNFEEYIKPKEAKRMDRFSQFAITSAMKALQDSGLEITPENADEVGVVIGSGVGGINVFEEQGLIFLQKGPRRISPFFIPMLISNMAAGLVAIYSGAKGPNSNTVTACAAGTHAVGDAYEIIKRGDAQAILAGGTEAALTRMAVGGFASMRALSTRNDEPETASRPFDVDRDGFIMGEGATVLVLESLQSALRRDARIYAEIVGYGLTGDAHHITAPAPEGEGAQRAMKMAMKKGNIELEMVDYINAHGTSTPLNDKTETEAIKAVFGEHAYKLKISSTKSMTGHLLGATGAFEAAATCLTILHDKIPPTMNLHNPDPDCDLDYVPNKYEDYEVNIALSNSLGFGGHNGTLVFKKFRED